MHGWGDVIRQTGVMISFCFTYSRTSGLFNDCSLSAHDLCCQVNDVICLNSLRYCSTFMLVAYYVAHVVGFFTSWVLAVLSFGFSLRLRSSRVIVAKIFDSYVVILTCVMGVLKTAVDRNAAQWYARVNRGIQPTTVARRCTYFRDVPPRKFQGVLTTRPLGSSCMIRTWLVTCCKFALAHVRNTRFRTDTAQLPNHHI